MSDTTETTLPARPASRRSRAERRARARRESRSAPVEEPKSTAEGDAVSELESRLADLWTEVLGRPPYDVEDNFFDVGGDSRRLARLGRRVNATVGRVSLVQLFRHPTIASLARHLAGTARPAAAGDERAGRPPGDRSGDRSGWQANGAFARQRRFAEQRRTARRSARRPKTQTRRSFDDAE